MQPPVTSAADPRSVARPSPVVAGRRSIAIGSRSDELAEVLEALRPGAASLAALARFNRRSREVW